MKIVHKIRFNYLYKCVPRPRFTEWELKFIEDLIDFVEAEATLTQKQINKIDEMYSKARRYKGNMFDLAYFDEGYDYTFDEVHDFDR